MTEIEQLRAEVNELRERVARLEVDRRPVVMTGNGFNGLRQEWLPPSERRLDQSALPSAADDYGLSWVPMPNGGRALSNKDWEKRPAPDFNNFHHDPTR